MKLSERIQEIVGKIRHFVPIKLWESLWDMADEVAQLEAENAALKRENALLCTYAMKLEGRTSNSSFVVDIRQRLGLSEIMMTWIIPDEHYDLLAQEQER